MAPDAAVPRDLEAVLPPIVRDLVSQGALAVVLAGSHARGQSSPLSDVDVYVIGSGPDYTLRVFDKTLVSLSWRTEAEEHAALRAPASVGAAVPGWRGARILHDPAGVAAALQAEARAFEWSTIAAECDAWVAEQITGYAEETLKLVAALRAGNRQLVAVQRSILALRLPIVMAVHHRLLYDSENRLWSMVAEAAGERWATAQDTAFGVANPGDADEAALTLYQLAVDEVRPLLSERQQAVAELALRASA